MNKRLLLFAALALVYCCVSFHRVTMAVIGDLIADEFHLGPTQLGFLGSALLYCYAFVQLPSGVFADNFGPKRTILLSLGLSTAGSLVFAFSPGYATALAGRVLIGVGIGFIYLSVIKILSAWYKENEFGTVLGFLLALGMLGNMLATAPLAVSVKFMGWRNSYLVAAVLTVGIVVLVIFRVKNTPDEDGAESTPVKDDTGHEGELTEDVPRGMGEKIADIFRPMKMLLRDRSYLMLVIFMVGGSSQAGFQTLWAGPFLSRGYGFSLVDVGNAMLWYSIGGMCGAPLWGFLSDRLFKSRKVVLQLTTAIAMVLWAIPAFMPLLIPGRAVPVLLFAIGLTWGAVILTHAMIRESFSIEMLGVAVGLINFFTFLGSAFFTQAMGHIVEMFPKTNGDYPLMAYQATIMLIFGMWVIRLIALSFAKERPASES
jgi:sugar phosphate permease